MKKAELIEEFEARTYQEKIFGSSINKNTFVVLPTGLGKTVIALMQTIYYFNKTNKKVLFLAPTKPLVEQQEKAFKSFIKNYGDFTFQVLVGTLGPKKRIDLYEKCDFIFSTPQIIENDLVNGIINPKDFCFIVFDEAHRATGNYSYNFIAQEFFKHNVKFLALSASPGTSKEVIDLVLQNMRIEHLEVRSYDDDDVIEYVNKTKLEPVVVEISKEFKDILVLLNKSYVKRLDFLKGLGFLQKKPMVTKTDLLLLQNELRTMVSAGEASDEVWKAISIAAALMKLSYGIELFESQEVSAAYNYFYSFFRGDSSKAAQELLIDNDFREAFERISKLKKDNVIHPKLLKLREIVFDEIAKNKDLRILIFNQYRDSATKIVSELTKVKEIKASIFVGQAKKGDVKMSQKDQKKILNDFRNGELNVLVSTSVGEEGLDIPKVDLVIFYEPVASAIRSIQRIGRTGRFKKGKAYVLQTSGTRDVVTSHIANAKEKKMQRVLKEIKDGFASKSSDNGLNKFINKESSDEDKTIDGVDERIPIYVDQRENNTLIKELYKLEEIKVIGKQLEVGDIVIDENIAIERKAKKDFVDSILDKRLFPQLIDLARNYRRPILIVEGEENIFAVRNVKPNVIRASLSAIAVDLRMPILFTNSMEETAQMVLTIAKRTRREKKDISLATDKRSFSENEELEKVVSSIPKINVVTAKGLLTKFKSIKELTNANEKELLECDGVGKLRAKSLKEFFEREYR